MTSETQSHVGIARPRPWLKPTDALARIAPSLLVNPAEQGSAHVKARYGYRIGDLGLLVSEQVGCEIITAPAVARIPTTPSWFLGVANLRGSLVPMFDLSAVLDMASEAREPARFGVIFDRGDHAVGILVSDHPKTLENLEPLPQLPPLPAAVRDFAANAFRHGSSIWLEFDHRRFFESISKRMAVFSDGEST